MSHRWCNLQSLIDSDGEVTIGHRASIGRTAAAMQERGVYALLRVGDGELLPEILDRLDAAVAKAVKDGVYTDEINR